MVVLFICFQICTLIIRKSQQIVQYLHHLSAFQVSIEVGAKRLNASKYSYIVVPLIWCIRSNNSNYLSLSS